MRISWKHQRAVELLRGGATAKQVAERLGISRVATVTMWGKEAGLNMPKGDDGWKDLQDGLQRFSSVGIIPLRFGRRLK